MSVDPVRGDGFIAVDGVPLVFAKGVDRVNGNAYGGGVSFLLQGEDEPSWFGRNLRLFGRYERQDVNAGYVARALGPTINNSLEITSVTQDGRAFASSSSSATAAVAHAGIFLPEPTVGLACVLSSGANTAIGFHDGGLSNFPDCGVTSSTAESQVSFVQDGVGRFVSAHATVLTGVPIVTEAEQVNSYGVFVQRGEVGFAGDYQVSPTLTLSPTLSLAIGMRRASFFAHERIADDLTFFTITARRTVEGTLRSDDAAVNLGLRGHFAIGAGVDLFASISGAAVRRKTDLAALSVASSVGPSGTTAATLFTNGDQTFHRIDTISAFQGALELGANYTFDPAIGVGPLRFSITGGLTYDSDVPTYGNVGAFDGPITGPIAPAHIAYSDEMTMTLKGAITVELP